MRSLSFKVQDLCLHNLIWTLTLLLCDIFASYVIQVLMPSDPHTSFSIRHFLLLQIRVLSGPTSLSCSFTHFLLFSRLAWLSLRDSGSSRSLFKTSWCCWFFWHWYWGSRAAAWQLFHSLTATTNYKWIRRRRIALRKLKGPLINWVKGSSIRDFPFSGESGGAVFHI